MIAHSSVTYVLSQCVTYVLGSYRDAIGSGIILWIFHAVISLVLFFLGASAFGIDIKEVSGGSVHWPLFLLMLGVVIKELFFLGVLMQAKSGTNEPDSKHERPNRQEWALDLILVSYTCITYSVTWGAITNNLSLKTEQPLAFLLNLFLGSLLFMIFYLPLRIPFGLEERAQAKTSFDKIKITASLFLALIPALIALR
ncbi:hypothetical protein JO972_15510 [Verrucomicrobiaceae bacterium 5K15]|uniref:Uncharacterized protein n=2 Tax=Oceaniferula flava TaxID=2800421 RepID=A0AAE2VA88_9BACT|nr:hypothetical protein [Oceaniferula flavus]MBM1137685.1 hypothetical protein [Oceaniferula flavus]